MLRVFSPSDTDFTSNGDVVIQATLAVVHKQDNGDFYLELQCGLEYLDYVKPKNIIVTNTPQGAQAFRIQQVETTRSKIIAKAPHLFYDSENYLIADSYVVDKNCNDALDHLNNATDTVSPFTTLSDVQTVASFRCVRKSLFEAVNTVLERWGGHLVRDNYNLQIKESIGSDNGVTIQYRKNLKEISVNYDWSGVCTKLLPVGKDGFTIDYVFSQQQYDIPYTKTMSFEQDIDAADYEDEDQYQTALRADLLAQAQKYLEISQYPAITYTLSANLDKITDIGDTVVVFDERLGVNITTHVLSFEYNCILDKYDQIQFGTASAKLSDLMSTVTSDINSSINENNQTLSVTLKDALTEAENKIWNALTSSYVIYEGNQILVVDALPAETATNVIRINSGGIAFSNTGISGDFVTAWTIDGTFNAQAINVINFTADLIKGGTLKLGSNLNQYGLIEIYDEENTLIAQLDKNGLKMYAQNGSYIIINTEVGFAGYDRLDNKLFWVSEDEFHQKKSVVEEEITLCNKLRFIPIEIYNGSTLVNDGIGLVSTE
jgi:phage minor structural protein